MSPIRPSASTTCPGASERPSRTSRRRRTRGRAIGSRTPSNSSLSLRPSCVAPRELNTARSGFLGIVTQSTGVSAPEIVTEGTGWYEQMGDRAELDVTFTAVARNRSDAVRELGRRVAAAEPALTQPGLQVRHRRVRVHNEWRDNRVVGCRAGEQLALLVTDVTALDAVLSALVGAEPTDLQGPTWVLEDPAAARREAQRRAVADARARAEGYAAALGGTLGS